jgi:uracil-DNA glycosylase
MLWSDILSPFWESTEWKILKEAANNELSAWGFAPPKHQIYRALELTPFDQIKVVILGQDPYHTPWVANGLAFSVREDQILPPSLRNIYKELESDLAIKRWSGDLSDWANQGVLLLNAILTVKLWEAASHQHLGWWAFTDFVIQRISEDREFVIFVLWWSFAQSKKKLINTSKHCIIESPHPSPLSAHRWFLGSKPFSQVNAELKKRGMDEIKW